MISFEEGFARIMSLASPLESEKILIENAFGRVLAQDLTATRPQPALDISAMDGYALCGEHDQYKLKGEVSAGSRERISIGNGDAVRIFTGAPLPMGADRILIQENAKADDQFVIALTPPEIGAHIRKQGQDFETGFCIIKNQQLDPEKIALIAAMNFRHIEVYRKPRVAILATGSELVEPSLAKSAFDVIASNAYGIAAMVEKAGGLPKILPILNDDLALITQTLTELEDFDIIVTTGGASVGKYDYTAKAAQNAGFELSLHKIAMRPGKPVIAGKKNQSVFLGLPGNPVSALITARLFLAPLMAKQQGQASDLPKTFNARLNHDLPQNGDRKHFMRAFITSSEYGWEADVFSNQDSATLRILDRANGLVIRDENQPSLIKNDHIKFLWL